MRIILPSAALILLVTLFFLVPEYKKVKTKELFSFMYTTCALINKFYDEKGHFPSEKENLIYLIYKDNEDKEHGIRSTNSDSAEFKYELGGGHSYRLYVKSKSLLNLPAIECTSNYKENYESKITHTCSVIE